MFYSNSNVDIDYKDCLRESFLVYKREGNYNYFSEPDIIYGKKYKSKRFKEILSSKNYRNIIDNKTPANLLIDSKLEKNELCDNYESYVCLGYPYGLEETELENIRSGKTLLRANGKNNVFYTVSKSDEWYVFKNFFAVKGNFGAKKNFTRLNLMSVWCVRKHLPDIEKFNSIILGLTTMSDIMSIDPSFRFFRGNEVCYSTHTFADENDSRITIEYKQDSSGIYRVSNVVKVREGYNLLPYLLPIDRQIIDPNYKANGSNEKPSSCAIL